MAISYPVSLPSTAPQSTKLRTRSLVGMSSSPFSGVQQVQEWPGEWLEADVSWPPMARATAEAIIAVLISLRGRSGTVLLGDSAGKTARGSFAGSPVVNGANAVASKTLAVKGLTASATGIAKAGDWIQLGSGTTQRLYKNLTDQNADGSGHATLDIFPRLREALADNAVITVASCKGNFRLTQNLAEWSIDEALIYGLQASFMEAF